MCTGNTIKPNSGDDTDCSISCDGTMKVANHEHTACSMSKIFIMYPNYQTVNEKGSIQWISSSK